jgi:YfiH family protein
VHRDERNGLRAYRFHSLAIDALVSTRLGGVSQGRYAKLNLGLRVNDDAELVLENRRRLFGAYGLDLERSVWCKQVHRDTVTVIAVGDAGRGALSEDGIVDATDALVTDVPGLTLCVTLADCVPVVLHDARNQVVGLAHAGWGGTVHRIASRTLAAMRSGWGTEPNDVVVAIGPSIAPEDYEVGPEVIERAKAAFGEDARRVLRPRDDGKAGFDLWGANTLDLEEAGVPRERIEIAGVSTAAALDEFYSHRLERETGRFITAVTLH